MDVYETVHNTQNMSGDSSSFQRYFGKAKNMIISITGLFKAQSFENVAKVTFMKYSFKYSNIDSI